MQKKLSEKKGLIHIYTGEGKGKTTAAFGLALRSQYYGKKILILQFLKAKNQSGEAITISQLPGVTVENYGRKGCLQPEAINEKDRLLVEKGWQRAREEIKKNNFDLIILDEILVVVHLNLISEAKIVKLLLERPEKLEIILTGRNASAKLIAIADIVSEIKSIKHPWAPGMVARKGIEY